MHAEHASIYFCTYRVKAYLPMAELSIRCQIQSLESTLNRSQTAREQSSSESCSGPGWASPMKLSIALKGLADALQFHVDDAG